MPITFVDDIKDINFRSAEILFYSRLKDLGKPEDEAIQIAKWMADAYAEGWQSGVEQSIAYLNQIK